ncbi:MAG TPA: hypothetical protein VLH79_08375, partial [Chthonomonadales bacterium]|nr:hypothetical protein [Chthonomonadales bacterium]
IYEQKGDQLSLFEDQEDDLIDINEAEEMLRSLRQEDPEEYKRIANLRDGIRSARGHCRQKGRYVMCAAGRYQQLFLLDEVGAVVSRETPTVLGAIKCSRDEPPVGLPAGYNAATMEALSRFADEVKQRRAQQRHSLSLTAAQSYVLRELRAFHAGLDGEDDLRAQVAALEQAFRRPAEVAIRRELNLLRRNGVTARPLVRALTDLYQAHGLGDRARAEARGAASEAEEIPHVVCSEALT